MNSHSPTIAVIGTINRDTVIRANGSRHESYGGILYNLWVLAKLLPNARLLPVTRLGYDLEDNIRGQLRQIPGIDLAATQVVSSNHNHCHLTYHSVSEKSEILRGWVGAASREQLRRALASDIILVNFISGGDITLGNLRWLRDHSEATIYIDFHSRTLGRDHGGRRFLRRPRDWREMIRCADFLQMNEIEFRLLSGVPPDLAVCRQFLRTELGQAGRGLFVTLGDKGCLYALRRGKTITAGHWSVRRTRKPVIDTTGCGDIFAAAFLAAYSARDDALLAARFAVDTASTRAAVSGIEQIDWALQRRRLRQFETEAR